MKFYVIIRGPLGSGKTTLAKMLAKKIHAKYISVDDILDKHKLTQEKEAGYISQKSFIKANEIIIKKTENIIKKRIIILDGNFYWKSQIKDIIERVQQPIYVFTLKASLNLCINRDKKRRKKYGENAVRAVYKKTTTFDLGKVIDVDSSKTACVTRIVTFLSKIANPRTY
ncbi:AAA family ATPase [Candidatus Woesearchaeota archaeon]|nr:AAA family ATPase [Candidatus Woesearchaeota archaeon]